MMQGNTNTPLNERPCGQTNLWTNEIADERICGRMNLLTLTLKH